jgi:hypothetical protein
LAAAVVVVVVAVVVAGAVAVGVCTRVDELVPGTTHVFVPGSYISPAAQSVHDPMKLRLQNAARWFAPHDPLAGGVTHPAAVSAMFRPHCMHAAYAFE